MCYFIQNLFVILQKYIFYILYFYISYMFYDFMYMVGFGSGSVQFDRIWIRPKGFERIRIRNTAYSPIKSMLSSVSREESGPSCSKKRAAVGCQEEPTKRACYRVSKKQSWARNNYLASRCDNVIQPQGPVRDQKKINTINILKWQLQTTLWPKTWSHCRDRIVACPALIRRG